MHIFVTGKTSAINNNGKMELKLFTTVECFMEKPIIYVDVLKYKSSIQIIKQTLADWMEPAFWILNIVIYTGFEQYYYQI